MPRALHRLYEWSLGCLLLAVACLLFASCSLSSDGDGALAGQDGAANGSGLKESPRTEKRNVVTIVLESTRARSVTPYNEDIQTTPFLDSLAEKSLLAERAYTTMPHTTKALISAECGVPPHSVREITEGEPGGIPVQCMADLLKEQGYKTALFQPGDVKWEKRPQLAENFGYGDLISLEDMDAEGFEIANYNGREDAIMLEPIRGWLKENGDEPFLNMYKTLTPHHPYVVPTRYGQTEFADWDRLNRYLNSVRYVDFFVKNIIEMYKEMGLYEETIFIIYGDHGEGFGEHERFQHDFVIWEEGLRVPLIVHDPQRFENGERVEGLANLADILPTVTDLLGYELPDGEYTGSSLLDLPKDRTLKFYCWHDAKCMASLKGDEKYIYHYPGEQPEGMEQEQFFDLSEDPFERHNLADERPEEVERRRKELFEWKSENRAMYGG